MMNYRRAKPEMAGIQGAGISPCAFFERKEEGKCRES